MNEGPSMFVGGWRPFIGWVGGCALAYQFVIYPLLSWFIPDPPAPFDPSMLLTLITGMLGIGTMRTIEKHNGVQTNGIRKKAGKQAEEKADEDRGGR